MSPAAISEHWTARPCRVAPDDLFALAGRGACALLYGDGPGARWLIAADDPLVVIDDPAELAALAFERRGDVPPIRPDLVGFATYEGGAAREPLVPKPAVEGPVPLPAIRFGVHRTIRVVDRAAGTLWTGTRRLAAGAPSETRTAELGTGPFRARKVGETDDEAAYRDKVEAVRDAIARGDVYQVNLTRQEEWRVEGSLLEFARRLFAANPAPYSALLAEPGFTIVSSSPELFLAKDGDRLVSRPIKGTVPRGRDGAADRALAEALRASPKDRAELAMIADLVRNDLARVARTGTVRVTEFPALESYANVHHLVAAIEAAQRPEVTLAGLLDALFPAGSITGCPKIAAMQMIRALEPWPRGIYTGAIGWLAHDASQFALSVAIRTAAVRDGRLAFGVGGGVVWDSDPAAEYAETVAKGASLVRCLSS